jgi:hypothetical protein
MVAQKTHEILTDEIKDTSQKIILENMRSISPRKIKSREIDSNPFCSP